MLYSIGLFFVFNGQIWAQDFLSLHLKARFDTLNEQVIGEVSHQFIVPETMDQVTLNAKRIEVEDLLLNGQKVDYSQNDTALFIPVSYTGQVQNLWISYRAKPRKGLYFIGWQDESRRAPRQIWTQGQGIDHRHWIPHHDDQRDKIIFSAEWIFHKDYQAMSNGLLDSVVLKEGENHWFYHMDKPMSSYLIALAIGKYDTTSQVVKGTPHLLYHYPDRIKDSAWYYYRHHRIAQFLEEEIDYDYPWTNYKQAPVRDFRHGAMENTCATIFGDFFLVDSIAFNDRNYTYVDAHEFAHQWFGNLVTAAGSKHHWLHEGFATYYQWLSERELYGQDYFEWELEKARQMVFFASRMNNNPLAHPEAGVERFYQKGGWLLYMLRNFIGDSIYREVIHEYLHTYAYQVVRNEDFIALCKKHSDQDIDAFFRVWLYGEKEPELRVYENNLKPEIILALEGELPQAIKLRVFTGGIWEDYSLKLKPGINSIPRPNEYTGLQILNSDQLLIKLQFDQAILRADSAVYGNGSLLNQLEYLLRLEPQNNQGFLQGVILDKGSHYSLRIRALQLYLLADDNRSIDILTQLLKQDSLPPKLAIAALSSGPSSLSYDLIEPYLFYSLSYDVRSAALEHCASAMRADLLDSSVVNFQSGACSDLERWQEEPGFPSYKNYLLSLHYSWPKFDSLGPQRYKVQDWKIRRYSKSYPARPTPTESLLDFAGPSFDFMTRITAISYLEEKRITSPAYHKVLWQAFFDKNWKLSKAARESLFKLRSNFPEVWAKDYQSRKSQWDDFQKRKAARIFETS